VVVSNCLDEELSMSDMEAIKEAVMSGNSDGVKQMVADAVAEGVDVRTILDKGLIAGLDVVGMRFEKDEIFIPEMLVAARAVDAGMAVVKPLLISSGIKERGIVVIGTVRGDIHEIGKNLVAMMLEGAGYRVINLGVNNAPENFVQAVAEHKPNILGMSALLTTTMSEMKVVIEELAPYRDGLKIMVGGAPVTQEFADEIGADGFARDAAMAVDVARMFVA
jgi:5-methyltetrahydrofolate--homocysteine methyltransferase